MCGKWAPTPSVDRTGGGLSEAGEVWLIAGLGLVLVPIVFATVGGYWALITLLIFVSLLSRYVFYGDSRREDD